MPAGNEVVIIDPTTGLPVTTATGTMVRGAAASGAAKAGNPVLVAGQDGTNAVTLKTDADGRVHATLPTASSWAVTHAPAANTQATISQAAGGGTVKNVCTSVSVTLTSAGAPTAAQLLVHLRDGASGAGTIKQSWALSVPAVAGESRTFTMSGLNIVGSANTAMTLEFAAAPGANAYSTVAMTGYTLSA